MGSPSDLQQVVNIISAHEHTLGLKLNFSKCRLWWPGITATSFSAYLPEVPRAVDGGIVVLGSPLGTREYVERQHMLVIDKLRQTLNTLKLLEDPQRQLILLRASLGLPRYSYLLRTGRTQSLQQIIPHFDQLITVTLSDIMGFSNFYSSNLESRRELSLPILLGGAGIPVA